MSRLYGTRPGIEPTVWRGLAFALGGYAIFALFVALVVWL